MSQNAFQTGVKPYQAVSEIWSKVLLKNLNLVGVYKHIAVDHSSELSANSDAIHLRLVDDSAITVQDYYTRGGSSSQAGTEGTITASDAKVKDVILVLDSTPYASVDFETYALKTANVDFQAQIINQAKYKVSKFIDNMIMNKIIAAVPGGNTLAPFDATAAAEGDVYDIMLQLAAILKKAGAVPLSNVSDLFGGKGMNETGYVVVNPDVMRFILKEPAFVKVDMTDKRAMWKDGVIRGTIAGLVVLESSVLETSGTTVNVFAGIKSASHFAIKLMDDKMMDLEDKFRVRWATLFGAGAVVSHPEALAKVVVTVKGA